MKNLSSNPAVNVLKNIGSSGLFLGAAVAYSAAAVLSFIFAVTPNYTVAQALQNFAYYTDLDPSVMATAASATSGSVIGALFGMIPTILIAVSLWLTYVSCRNNQTGGVSTAGMTICKVLAIILAVVVGLCTVLFLAVGVIMLAAGGLAISGYSYGYEGATVAVGAVVMIICSLALVVSLIYEIFVVKTINRIKGTALTGAPDDRVSQFVIVLNWITAVCSIIGGLTMLFTSFVGGLSSLASAACTILITLCLSQYKKQMRMLMYPPVQPVYAQPAGQPYQAPQPQAPQDQDQNTQL